MHIPKKIKLGGHIIKVKKVNFDEINSPGEFIRYHQVIRLRQDKDIPEDQQEGTFLHEIIEAIVQFNKLDLDHTHLTVLSESLYQVIKDNKIDWR